MNILKKALIAGGCAVILTLGTNSLMAQGRGGPPDPAAMKQRAMDNLREALEIKDDAEWNAIQPKLGKVYDASREVMSSRMRGFFGRGGQRRNNGGANADDNANNGGQRRNRGGFFGEPSSAVTALQKAVDDKAPTAEIKAKLKAVQDEGKDKLAKLTAAQEDLRAVLTPRQEAIATLNGMLQ
jgi:Spy/CpxP family protein refolding chaperone